MRAITLGKLVVLLLALSGCQDRAPALAASSAPVPQASAEAEGTATPTSSSVSALPAASSATAAMRPLPPLDAEAVAVAEKDVDRCRSHDRLTRWIAAALALEELEARRLPTGAKEALGFQGAKSLDLRARHSIFMVTMDESPALMAAWDRVCDSTSKSHPAARMLTALSTKSVDERGKVRILLGTCRLGRHGLVPLAEQGGGFAAVVFAHAVHGFLSAGGSLLPIERTLLSVLAAGFEGFETPIAENELNVWRR